MGVFLSLSSLSLIVHLGIILIAAIFEVVKKLWLARRPITAPNAWRLPMIQVEQLTIE